MIESFYTQSIDIENATITLNDFGGEIETWSNFISTMGYIDLIRGDEKAIAGSIYTDATHILMCKNNLNITNKMRVKKDNIIYRILYVDNVFKNHLEILLKEIGVDGL